MVSQSKYIFGFSLLLISSLCPIVAYGQQAEFRATLDLPQASSRSLSASAGGTQEPAAAAVATLSLSIAGNVHTFQLRENESLLSPNYRARVSRMEAGEIIH